MDNFISLYTCVSPFPYPLINLEINDAALSEMEKIYIYQKREPRGTLVRTARVENAGGWNDRLGPVAKVVELDEPLCSVLQSLVNSGYCWR